MAKTTPLHSLHLTQQAKTTEFAGWEMPVYYSSIKEEHAAVRNNAGLFDLGHMGAIKVSGDAAISYLQKLLTNDIARLASGDSQYSMLLNENGGVIDDVFVYCVNDFYILVVNASNEEKVFAWLKDRLEKNVSLSDLKERMTIIAIQGPKSQEILQKTANFDLSSIGHHKIKSGKIKDKPIMASRTGYTGEDGFELFFEKRDAELIWSSILEEGRENGIISCGLGARDTLRLEAGYPLYGHEYNESTTPYEAGFSFAVKLEKEDVFIGKEALLKQKESGINKKLIGLKMLEKMIPRQGYDISYNENIVGAVTSGTLSPTLGYPIGLGYVEPEHAVLGKQLEIDIRGRKFSAKVTKLPFYKKPQYNL